MKSSNFVGHKKVKRQGALDRLNKRLADGQYKGKKETRAEWLETAKKEAATLEERIAHG